MTGGTHESVAQVTESSGTSEIQDCYTASSECSFPSTLTSEALLPSPPQDPLIYIAFNPWTFPEYLLLQSIIISHSNIVGDFTNNVRLTDWNRVARTLNETAASFSVPVPYRTAWDCWHRYSVPWLRPSPTSTSLPSPLSVKPTNELYPDAPGVQRAYTTATLQADMHQLIDIYTILTKMLLFLHSDKQQSATAAFSICDIISDVFQTRNPPRSSKRSRHPGKTCTLVSSCASE